jgi:hypothetical protein
MASLAATAPAPGARLGARRLASPRAPRRAALARGRAAPEAASGASSEVAVFGLG